MNDHVISVSRQIESVLEKLPVLRQNGNTREYKTLTDTFKRLYSIYTQQVRPKTVLKDCGGHPRLFKVLDDATYTLFEKIFKVLNDELELIDNKNNKNLLDNNLQEYREWVLCYEKIIEIHSTVKDELSRHYGAANMKDYIPEDKRGV